MKLMWEWHNQHLTLGPEIMYGKEAFEKYSTLVKTCNIFIMQIDAQDF
jgi:hypothetical protein